MRKNFIFFQNQIKKVFGNSSFPNTTKCLHLSKNSFELLVLHVKVERITRNYPFQKPPDLIKQPYLKISWYYYWWGTSREKETIELLISKGKLVQRVKKHNYLCVTFPLSFLTDWIPQDIENSILHKSGSNSWRFSTILKSALHGVMSCSLVFIPQYIFNYF